MHEPSMRRLHEKKELRNQQPLKPFKWVQKTTRREGRTETAGSPPDVSTTGTTNGTTALDSDSGRPKIGRSGR